MGSKKLCSVRLSPVGEGDEKAPYYISGLSGETRKAKEASVFDRAISDIADVHGTIQLLMSFLLSQSQ